MSRSVSPVGGLARPADVEPGEVAHRERSHRHAEVVEHAVDVPGHGAFERPASFASRCRWASMRLPTKPWQTPTSTADLADAGSRAASRWRPPRPARLRAAHHLEEPHDVRRREEVQADARLRAGRSRRRSRRRRDRRCWRPGSRPASRCRRACAKMSFLSSMFSNIASMTRSQPARSSMSSEPVRRPMRRSTSLGLSRPLRGASPRSSGG